MNAMEKLLTLIRKHQLTGADLVDPERLSNLDFATLGAFIELAGQSQQIAIFEQLQQVEQSGGDIFPVLRLCALGLIKAWDERQKQISNSQAKDAAEIALAKVQGKAIQPQKIGEDCGGIFDACPVLDLAFEPGRFSNSTRFKVQIRKHTAIRIFGTYEGKPFDQAFFHGEKAEYDSYNLSYTAPICGITEKTVSFQLDKGEGSKTKRLSLIDFAWRNHDFDLGAVMARNAETHQHI